jgi:hypothetical protein
MAGECAFESCCKEICVFQCQHAYLESKLLITIERVDVNARTASKSDHVEELS